MTSVATLVQDAMFEAQILGAGETAEAEDADYAVRILNRMIGTWANESLLTYATTEETFNTIAGQVAYSTSLLASRPTSIDSMFVRQNSIDYPIEMIDEQTYNDIGLKTTAGIPSKCFYTPTYPNGSFSFYLAPNGVYEVHVLSRKPLTATLTLASDVLLPEGYEQAIVHNLASLLCVPFGMNLPPALAKAATDAKAWLKRVNYMPLEMKSVMNTDSDLSNTFIYKGF